jgi:tetratricopeptide (TPR) repeat protein
MYDLARVPDRPPVVFSGAVQNKVVPVDSAGQHVLHLEPELPDTNDANTYYRAGLASLWKNPSSASASFYWASQLNPGWADPYFARWYTLQVMPRVARRRLPDSVQQRVDSLVLTAMIHDPFFDERLTMNDFVGQVHSHVALAQKQVNEAVSQENQRRFQAGEPMLTASRLEIPHTWYLAFAERHFDSASHDLAREIKKHPDALALYVYRSKAQYYLRQYDSAAATLAAAIRRVDLKDTTKLLPVYFSREMFYYASGIALMDAKHDSAARLAFENAVTENLGFYMAHLHLASRAIARRDSATAINEARIAAQIRPTDPLAQFLLGYSLLDAGHPADAIDALRAAVADDPYFALPYFYLAQAREAVHDTVGSRESYRGFMAHAALKDTLRKTAARAISRLGGT